MKKYMTSIDLEPVFLGEIQMASAALKQKLFNLEIKKRECENCGIVQWCDKEAPLELHHLDGNSHNNKLDNLKILCPNCHSQTHSFCKAKKYRITEELLQSLHTIVPEYSSLREVFVALNLPYRGMTYLKVSRYIKTHNLQLKPKPVTEKILTVKDQNTTLQKRVIEKTSTPKLAKSNWYPTNQELFEAVWNRSVLDLSRSFGVTSNAIKNRCKRRGIPVPPPGYWAKLKHGKIEECLRIKEECINKSGWVPTNSPPGV